MIGAAAAAGAGAELVLLVEAIFSDCTQEGESGQRDVEVALR